MRSDSHPRPVTICCLVFRRNTECLQNDMDRSHRYQRDVDRRVQDMINMNETYYSFLTTGHLVCRGTFLI